MTWDTVWEEIHKSREWGKYPSEPLVRFVASNFLKIQSGKTWRMLEIGCGTGANLWFLAREGIETYGVEGSAFAAIKARERLNQETPGWRGDITEGDIINLPYESGFFDAVIDIEAVTHNKFTSAKKIYDEAYRVLKPGGKLFSQTFSTGSWGDETGEQIEKNGWVTSEGPTSLGEFVRFTPYEDIKMLLSAFDHVNTEKMTRTMENGQESIIEWIVVADKK